MISLFEPPADCCSLEHLEETRAVLSQYDDASRELADESCQELLSQQKVLQALKRQLDLTYESLM